MGKNTFGINLGAPLVAPDLGPGMTSEITLAMQPGVLLNGAPPSNPLFLQIAIKNSLDVYYFNIPFDLRVVLVEDSAFSRDQFTELWQRVGPAGEQAVTGNVEKALTPDYVKTRLALDNVHYVAQRPIPDTGNVLVYVSAMTVSNCPVLGEISVSSNSLALKIAVRTETPALAPLFHAVVSKALSMR